MQCKEKLGIAFHSTEKRYNFYTSLIIFDGFEMKNLKPYNLSFLNTMDDFLPLVVEVA
jgi:hypothetical protein